MRCLKCGAELPEGSIFCNHCGTKMEADNGEAKNDASNIEKAEHLEEETEKKNKAILFSKRQSGNEEHEKRNTPINDKLQQGWKKLSIFGKVMTIAIAICFLLCLIAFVSGKILAGIISIIQMGLLITGWLIKNQRIKVKKGSLFIILIAVALLFTVPYFLLFSASKKPSVDMEDFQDDTELTETLSELIWPDNNLTDLLPIPKSTKGYVEWDHSDKVSIYVGDTTQEDYKAYIAACKEKGFSTITFEDNGSYCANNEAGYRLSLNYQEEHAMNIAIKDPVYIFQIDMKCVSNLLLNKYDVVVYVDENRVGTLEHGAADIFDVELEKGTHTIKVTKEDDESIDGSATVDISESVKIGYSIQCQSNQIEISEEYTETLAPLEEGQIKVPVSAEEYCSEIYANVAEELKTAGFTNITGNAIHDLADNQSDDDGDIENISIDGQSDFRKAEVFDVDAKIIITYHTLELSSEEMWDKIVDHGGDGASDMLKSFDGTGYTVICYVAGEVIGDFNPEGYIFEDGWLEPDEKAVHLNFTTEKQQALKQQLEGIFPQENAKRAAVVALTNSQATDVFNDDGNTYNPSKFHSYSDLSDFYLSVTDEGEWQAISDNTWHVNGLKCMLSGYGTYLKASLDVSFDGTNYIVSNVDKIIAAKEYIESDDSSKINKEHLEPSENTPYLTVSLSLIQEDRDHDAEQEQNNKTTPTDKRTAWIDNQFSILSGTHKDLEKLIKNSLNDEKSYKHIETTYIDVTNEDNKALVNETIASTGYQVEIGDLFVITKFSAKNAFDATIKNTAYGIVSYNDNTVKLIAIE